MAKKPNKKTRRYEEGFIRGRRALLVGVIPILAFFGLVVFSTWLIIDYFNKLTVNTDKSGICTIVRQQYSSTIKPEYPCQTTDKGTYWLATFSQSSNTSNAPTFITFKVEKKDNAVSPGIDIDEGSSQSTNN